MTITFHPYCWYRKQGGERTLFVRVTFRKQSRKIATTITVTQADLTRTGKVKSPAILNKYEDLVRQMRDAVSDLNAFALDAMTVDDVVRHIRKRMEGAAFRQDFIAFGREAARKSWASIARNNAGVDKATVDECLCHRGDLRLADIYIEKDWSLLWRAIRVVVEHHDHFRDITKKDKVTFLSL